MTEAIGPATGVFGPIVGQWLTGHRPGPFNRKPRLSGASPRSG
jgi:hypothetical protein